MIANFSLSKIGFKTKTTNLLYTPQGLEPASYKQKRDELSFFSSVPLDVLFSNELLTDLARIWALRYIIEDPEIVECKHFIRMA